MTETNTNRAKILQKLKQVAKGGWKDAAEAPAKAKGSQLPGGIVRGVARLSSWKMDEDKNGNPYFMITGIVLEPVAYAGARATVSHFISETKTKTIQQKLDGLSSDLQLLLPGCTSGTSLDEVPAILDQVVGEQRHFFFNTWKPEQDSDTMVFIQGAATQWDTVPEQHSGEADEPVDPDVIQETVAEQHQGVEAEASGETAEEIVEEEVAVEEPVAEEPVWEPQVTEEYSYKGTAVIIEAVNKENRTVKAKIKGTKKAYPTLSWDLLESALP